MFNAFVQDIVSGMIDGQTIGVATEQANRNLAAAAVTAAAAAVKQPTMPMTMQQNRPGAIVFDLPPAPHHHQQQMPPQLFQNPVMYGPGTWTVPATQNPPVAAPPPAAPVRPPPPPPQQQQQQPQRQIGFCYSCNRRVYVTQQKTCNVCFGGFVELEEPPGPQYLPPAPLPTLPPVIERTPPPPMPPAIPVIPTAPVARQKRQYTRRTQVQAAVATLLAGPANPYAQTPGITYTNVATLQAPPQPPVNAPRPTASYATTNSIQPTTSETASKRKESGAKTPTKRQRKNAAPTKDAAEEATKENSPYREEYECKICFEAQSDCVFLGCSHMCACYKCGLNIHQMKGECPICRKPIEKVILVFRA